MTKYRIEKDSLGEVKVPLDKKYGPQTQRSLENFKVGSRKMPLPQIYAMVNVKKACALANHQLGLLSTEKRDAITKACDEILAGKHDHEFVLSVYQTGSGTQSNMNVNEVIASVGGANLHPNDDVNKSQSSNDVFPSGMHIATYELINQSVLPSLSKLISQLEDFISTNGSHEKVGRTHLQDATNLTVAQEFSAYVSALKTHYQLITDSTAHLLSLAQGGTAVGTGINTPEGFIEVLQEKFLEVTGVAYKLQNNKFEHLSLKVGLTNVSSQLRQLANTLYKMANDIRFLASGPRMGYGELLLEAHEPGSSIMPGKVNPTQCESIMMVCVTVMGHDEIISLASSQGNFQLNVMMPVMIDKMVETCELLSDSMNSFTRKVIKSLTVNEKQLKSNVLNNLMSATGLNPYIGYEKAAEVVKYAFKHDLSILEAGLLLKAFNQKEYERWTSHDTTE